MTSSEQDDKAIIKKSDSPIEETTPANHGQRFNTGDPDATTIKPPVILPITGKDATVAPASETGNIRELNEAEANTDGDVIDNGNNYTAAENDHDNNATL